MKEKMRNLERWLSSHIGTVSIIFGGIVFLTWFIPLLNLPLLPGSEAIFGVKQIKGVITTQSMFTTIGAIFAFWYGYKKYERDKSIDFLNNNIQNLSRDKPEKIFFHWVIGNELYEKGYISEKYWNYIMDTCEMLFLEIVIIETNEILNIHIPDLSHRFGKNNIYFKDYLNRLKKHLEDQELDLPIDQYTRKIQIINSCLLFFN